MEHKKLKEVKKEIQVLLNEVNNFISSLEYVKTGFLTSVNSELQKLNQKISELEQEVIPKTPKEQVEASEVGEQKGESREVSK